MKLYIFGAGASFASQKEMVGLKPPLVNDLFNQEYGRYAQDIGISTDELIVAKKEFINHGGSLERWLTDKWNNIENLKQETSKDAERVEFAKFTFYVWHLLKEVSKQFTPQNLYIDFLLKLRKKDLDFGFINFNYDTLLDRAYQKVFGAILSGGLNAYVKCKYIKPHGSVNWFIKPRPNDVSIPINDHRSDFKTRLNGAISEMFKPQPISIDRMVVENPQVGYIHDWNYLQNEKFNYKFFYPLVLLPLSSKLYQHFDGFYEKVLLEGNNLVRQADEIFLIGYRGEDDAIKEMLSSAKEGTILNVVSRSDSANKIMESVCGWCPQLDRGKVHEKGFLEFIENY